MKKSLVSLLLVGALVAPSALVFAEETTTDPGTNPSGVSQQDIKNGDYYSHTVFDQIDEAEVEYVETDTLPLGEKVVETEAVNGIYKYDVYSRYVDGEVTDTVNDGPVYTTDRVDGVTLVGTGVMGEERATWIIEQPFIVEIVEDSDMYIGEEEVVQEGIDGFVKYATVYETKDGKRTGNTIGEDKVIVDSELPQNKIIKRGTKEVEGQYILTVTLTNGFDEPYPDQVVSVTGHNFASRGTTDENGITTFSVPSGEYTVSAEGSEQKITIDDEDSSVQLKVELDDIGAYSREDLLGRGDDLITFETQEDAQAAIDALDEEEREGLEVAETDDGLFYVAHVIPVTPIQPGVNTKDIVDGVKEKFPTFDNEDYTYETEVTETKVIVTIKNKEGHLVAVVEYDHEKEAYSVKPAELTPAKPIEKDSEVVADQPIQVNSTESVESRESLPETGELGSGLTIMAAALSALGGLGLLFKKRK